MKPSSDVLNVCARLCGKELLEHTNKFYQCAANAASPSLQEDSICMQSWNPAFSICSMISLQVFVTADKYHTCGCGWDCQCAFTASLYIMSYTYLQCLKRTLIFTLKLPVHLWKNSSAHRKVISATVKYHYST